MCLGNRLSLSATADRQRQAFVLAPSLPDDRRVKRISYSGAQFVTSDAVETALMDLVAGLGSADSTMHVEIPAWERGIEKTIGIVIGPSSEIISEPIESDLDEPPVEPAVAELRRLSNSLRPSRPIADSDPQLSQSIEPTDLD